MTTDPSQAASPVTPLLVLPGPQYNAESPEAGERKMSVLLLTLRAKLGEALDAEADLGQGRGAFGGLQFSLSVSAHPLQQRGRS